MKQCHGLNGDAFRPPDYSPALHRRGFDPDFRRLDLQNPRNIRLHLRDVRLDLGHLGHNDDIHIADSESPLANPPKSLLQQKRARGVSKTRVVVREMRSDVRQSGRAQDCVGHGVQQGIRVRMALQTLLEGDMDSPEDEPAIR